MNEYHPYIDGALPVHTSGSVTAEIELNRQKDLSSNALLLPVPAHVEIYLEDSVVKCSHTRMRNHYRYS